MLMFLSFSLPVIPSFVKLDFSELPALIAAFSMGPASGVAVCFLKNLINLAMSSTAGVGELCNFLLASPLWCLPGCSTSSARTAGARCGALCWGRW